MKYRSRIDIIAQILQTAMKGAPKSRLMYGAFLSYSQLQEYLEFMMQRELLIHENGIYRLSSKGLHLLNVYDDIFEAVSIKDTPTEKRESLIEVRARNSA